MQREFGGEKKGEKREKLRRKKRKRYRTNKRGDEREFICIRVRLLGDVKLNLLLFV